MHAVLITFDCEATPEQLSGPFTDYAAALRDQSGLISKAWIVTGRGYGGFHVFSSRAAAESYLSSDLAAGLMATDGFENFTVDHYDILDDLSTMTGVANLAGRSLSDAPS